MLNNLKLLKNTNVFTWSLYDIADTVYFVGIVGIFFPLWITKDMGGNDGTVAFTLSISIGISLLLSFVLGCVFNKKDFRFIGHPICGFMF